MNKCQDGIDYRKFYDANLESYPLTEVRRRFQESTEITPLDFYLILHWKAPRAKNRTRERLARVANGGFSCTVKEIGRMLHETSDSANRLGVLMSRRPRGWGFRLATATAILTVLFPEDFTVYDTRVCESLGGRFRNLKDRCFSPDLYAKYSNFKREVERTAPPQLSLRDKDRYLWGKSFYEQAMRDCR
jgi:hypothetical protein